MAGRGRGRRAAVRRAGHRLGSGDAPGPAVPGPAGRRGRRGRAGGQRAAGARRRPDHGTERRRRRPADARPRPARLDPAVERPAGGGRGQPGAGPGRRRPDRPPGHLGGRCRQPGPARGRSGGASTRPASWPGWPAKRARGVAWSASPQLACAQLATAVCAYHRDDLPAAWAALDLATRAALPGDRPLRLAAAVLGGWMAAASGRDQASAALRHLDVAIAAIGGRPPRLLAAAARAARARLLATAGDDEAALAALGPGDRPRPAVETVVLGRLQLAQGDPMAAVRTLAPLLASEPGGERSRRRWRSRPTWSRPWPTGSWPTTPPPSARYGGPSTWPRPRATAVPSSRVGHRCASCWPTTCTGTTPTTRWSARCWSGSGRPSRGRPGGAGGAAQRARAGGAAVSLQPAVGR